MNITGYGETEWFGIGKGVRQGSFSPLDVFNLYSESIKRKSNLDDIEAGVRIGGRRIRNLRKTDDMTLLAESKEDFMKLLQTVKKENVKAGLRLKL